MRIRGFLTFAPLLFFLFFGPILMMAETVSSDNAVADGPEDIQVMVFEPWNLSDTAGEEDQAYRNIMQDLVSNGVRSAGYSLLPSQSWESFIQAFGSDDVFGSLPLLVARQAESDLAIAIYYRQEGSRLFIMIKAYDVHRRRLIAAEVEIARSGLVLVNSVSKMMESLMGDIQAAEQDILFMKNNPGVLTGTIGASVHFSGGMDGTRLSIPGIGHFDTVENGEADLPYQPLAMGQVLEIIKEADGFYTSSQNILIRDTTNEVELSGLYPSTSQALELSWNAWAAFGLAASYRHYLIPDSTFLRGFYQFYLQFPPPDLPPGGSVLSHHDFEFTVGQYLLFPPSSPFRFAYGGGLGLTLHPTPGSLAIDTYITLASMYWEFNRPHWTIYLKQDLRYSFPIFAQHFFEKGLDMNPNGIPTTLGVVFKWQ